MFRVILALALLAEGCGCQDYIPEKGRACRYHGQELRLERTSPLAPPLAVCRCPCETVPQHD